MCKFYDVSRSGYYDWIKRRQDNQCDDELLDLITECHNQHKKRYGYRRIVKWLKREKGLTKDMANHKPEQSAIRNTA